MATSSGRRVAAVKFFKVIHLDPKADSLTIPPEFTKRHGQNLPSSVFLKVPFGTPMEVKLVRSDGKAVLQRGWKEFKNRYSIGYGHFLVFEQNGKSEFNVAIFDKSAVEITYPVHADNKRGKRKAENDPIQISDDDIGPVKLEDSTPEECYSGSQCWDGVERERAVAKETSMAYKKAMDIVSVPKNPFFVCLLQPSYVSGRSILNMSISFAKQNLCSEGANSIIMVTNGKKWPGRCIVRNNIAGVTVGWKKFVQDNGLKVGDACVFEVANKSKNHVWQWNVVIFRKSECVGMDNRSGRGLAAPKFCKIVLDPRADTLEIPLEFTKRIGHTLPNRVFLKVSSTGSTAMEVELVRTNNGQTMLQKGWRKFKERHSLAFGHFLVFEYNENSEFNVRIFDKSAVETNYHSHADYNNKKVTNKKPRIGNRSKTQENTTRVLQQNHSERKPDCRVKLDHGSSFEECGDIGATRQFSKKVEVQRTVVKKEACVAYKKAVAFASAHINPKKNPFLIRLMQHSYVSYGFYLNLPFSFAKQNRLCDGANSISMVTNRKKWRVRCIVKDSRANLSGGWMCFAQDNGLKIHDVCVFVVAERTEPEWNVVIFRS